MSLFEPIIESVESLATKVPLELYVTVGSFIEEIVAPIPSPVVMVLAGSIAHTQNHSVWFLLWLALFGSVGKTAGALVLYFVADKLEDVVLGKFGKFIGLSHKQVETIGKKFQGGFKDDIFLFIARAIPIIPSAPVSVVAGLIKLNLKTFIVSTLLGTFVRDLMYLYLGFEGLDNYKQVSSGFENAESIGQLILLAVIAGIIVFAYFRRKHH